MTTINRTNTCRDCKQPFPLDDHQNTTNTKHCPSCIKDRKAEFIAESRLQEHNAAVLAAAIEEEANTIYVDGYAGEATRRYLIEIGYYPKGFRITQKETA